MRHYRFNKPLIEATLPVRDTNSYYVDIDENTGELANIMEFTKNEWQVKYLVDDITIWSNSSNRLNIPSKIKLNPNGIIAAWLKGNEYKSAVKDAADEAGFSHMIDELKSLCDAVNGALPVIEAAATAAEGAGDTLTKEALDGIFSSLSEAVGGFNDDEDLIDNLKALDNVIQGTSEEQSDNDSDSNAE